MAIRIDDNCLAGCARNVHDLAPLSASDLVVKLGVLSRWWLIPQVIEKAKESPHATFLQRLPQPTCQDLPSDPGCCTILLALDNLPLLGDAQVFCVRWRKGATDSDRLPTSLKALAQRVRELLATDTESYADFGLEPAGAFAGYDFSGLTIATWGSAGVSLAVALRLASKDEKGSPGVWATGEVGPAGVSRIQGAAAKARLAARFGASLLVVPGENLEEARSAAADSLEVEPLSVRAGSLRGALAPCLIAHLQRPAADRPLNEQIAYHDRLMKLNLPHEADRFYHETLLKPLGQQLREQSGPRPADPLILISIVSGGTGLNELLLAAVQPRYLVLLHTPDMAHEADRIKTSLSSAATIELHEFSGDIDQLIPEFSRVIDSWRQQHGDHRLVFDLTGGKVFMRMALFSVARPGDYLHAVHSDHYRHKLPVPGSQTARYWPVGQTWADDLPAVRNSRLVLLGNSFPQSLIRRRVVSQPISLAQARQMVQSAERVLSFWGHDNTASVASRVLGRDVRPVRPDGSADPRPAIVLNEHNLPGLYGQHTDTVILLSPQYIAGYRPAIGEETPAEKITGWVPLHLAFVGSFGNPDERPGSASPSALSQPTLEPS